MANARFEALAQFWAELRRRKVFRVAGAYAIVGWLVIQIAANTFPALLLPPWTLTLVIVLTALGFPIALVIAWLFERTPSGIRPEVPIQSLRPTEIQPPGSAPAKSPIIAHRGARRSRTQGASRDPDPISAASVPLLRVQVSQLRHDLRTPMNAILGYGEMLVTEATELGIGNLLPDLQRLCEDSKRMLERITEAVPAGDADSDADIADIRVHAREKLLQPSHALLKQAQEAFAKIEDAHPAHPDLERLTGAASKLLALIESLAEPDEAQSENRSHSVAETLIRLTPITSNAPTGGGTLLVVDDNAMNRDLLTRQLVREGYNVFAAASGREALETLNIHNVDLVLLDVVMPEMDGIQLLEHIQRDSTLSIVPVIMTSALDEIAGVARCLEKGAVDYLTKPFEPVLLKARVRTTLEIRHLREDLRQAEQQLEDTAAVMRRLAHSIVPASVAPNLDRGEVPGSTQYPDVTAVVVYFDGIDAIASRRPAETTKLLSQALTAFEQRSRAKGLELTRATDRSFTVIAGAPGWSDLHADVAADIALDLHSTFMTELPNVSGPLHITIGVHSGALITGVTGDDTFVFGLWGDAVTTAAAIAAHAPGNEIYLSATTGAKLSDRFGLDAAVVIDLPGQGRLSMRRLKQSVITTRGAADHPALYVFPTPERPKS